MMVAGRRTVRRQWAAVAAALLVVGVVAGISEGRAAAAVSAVKGSAFGYYTNVGLFGGPQTLLGRGEAGRAPGPNVPASTDPSFSPHVALPAGGGGGSMSATDTNGASATYGPAVIHGGRWPCEETGGRNCPATAPPSGPMAVSTAGTPASGTVTSTADITLHPTPIPVACYAGYGPSCFSPGGFGPFPVEGDSLHVECTANEAGVTGSTTFSNADLATSTDGEGNPLTREDVPDNPPPNYTRHGVITNVGDVFSVVYNEQIRHADGSLTVNAAHMYLFGPTAIGDVVRGSVTCGTTPASAPASDTRAPTCGTAVVKPMGPEDPTPQVPRSELVGVFDAGTGAVGSGLKSITNIQVINGTVQVGYPESSFPYLNFVEGQVGPLAVNATRTEAAESAKLPMIWWFDATDMAGNVRRCRGVIGEPPLADFNGNGTSDPSVYRNGAWYALNQPAAFFGLAGFIPVPADYDGDGDADRAVFNDGAWYVDGLPTVFFGVAGDVPVPGDYNGDGDAERAVYRPAVGGWYVEGLEPVFLGQVTDIPVPADYDGNGTTDRAVYSDGAWYVHNQPTVFFGLAGFIPVPGDYDGNGVVDRAVFKDGAWYVHNQPTVFFGLAGHMPEPADYDGNGTTDRAVFDQGTWYIHNQPTVFWGLPGDVALPLPHAIGSRFAA